MSAAAPSFRFPPMLEARLPNGLNVIWVPQREHPAMTVALQIPAGKFCDSREKEGIAELAVALLQKGPASLSTEEFAEKLEHTGASLFSEVGDEHIIIGCQTLSRFAGMVVPLFWEMVRDPALDEQEFGRLRREMTAATQAELVDPGTLVKKHFYAELFGAGHPAGRTHTVASIKRITIQDIRDFCAHHLFPGNSHLVVAGDFDISAARSSWETLFASWNTAGQEPPPMPAPPGRTGSTVVRLVDKPDLSQTSLAIGHEAPGELHDDRELTAVANYILGGGNFSSRLMNAIRTKGGKTYGISSQIACNNSFGAFMISTSTQNRQTGDVLTTILSVYRDFIEKGVTDEELAKAKQFAIGSMAFQLEGIGNIADKLLWLRLYKRDNSYIERFDRRIAAITRDDINRAISRHLRATGLVISAVGKTAEIRPSLAGHGTVKTYNYRTDP
jgi:predicted Zn-dependent peptidase